MYNVLIIDFTCAYEIQIRCPDDYRQWLVSMFSLFGTKFVKLYCGPMWRVETTSQDSDKTPSSSKSPVEVHVHVHILRIFHSLVSNLAYDKC